MLVVIAVASGACGGDAVSTPGGWRKPPRRSRGELAPEAMERVLALRGAKEMTYRGL